MAEHVRGCNLLRPNHSGACCTCEPGSAVCKRGCPRRTPDSTPTEREAGDAGEVAAVLAEPLCRAICDLLGEPRILVPGEVLALLSRPPVAAALAPLMAEREAAAGARALREAADRVAPELGSEIHGHTSTRSVRNWLRDRAAALAPESEEQP